ncbi:unnamed protein product, partial [Phaeothamnion confervicola]
ASPPLLLPPAARPLPIVAGCPECEALRAAGLTAPLLLREERHEPAPFRQRAPPERKATWRLRERMKTANVGLLVCLNIGTDPPDVIKTNPCARKECWINVNATSRSKARESVGRALQDQYERLQPRARYKQCLDPTVDDVRKLCAGLRRSAKGDRVLLHYNGHGVPRPTSNGELWVFNKTYTQYIPLSVHDLKAWVGGPSIYVLDCSAAGILLPHFVQPSWGAAIGGVLGLDETPPETPPDDGQGHRHVLGAGAGGGGGSTSQLGLDGSGSGAVGSSGSGGRLSSVGSVGGGLGAAASSRDCIVLAACRAHELLPMNPELPADVFTSCLTTPLRIALRWFISQNRLSMWCVEPGWVDEIPGKVGDRKTPLGELNWVFTAITDTIAWNCLPSQLFQKLFRQDLLLASLFRNFLLADRVLRSFGCTPVSHPRLPATSMHPLWQSWDLAAESCLSKLHQAHHPRPQRSLQLAGGGGAAGGAIAAGGGPVGVGAASGASGMVGAGVRRGSIGGVAGDGGSGRGGAAAAGQRSSIGPERGSVTGAAAAAPVAAEAKMATDDGFFREQLTAFEVWLQFGGQVEPRGADGPHKPPEQLPVVLQVLLSQAHRLRALQLLRRSLDLGPWAVDLALSVGIFPYVLKLLGSPTPDLRQVLVRIWARVLTFDRSCQVDLLKDGAHTYFITHLGWPADVPTDQRVMAAYILTAIMDDFLPGQAACLQQNLMSTCATLLAQRVVEPAAVHSGRQRLRPPAALRRWLCLCLAKLCWGYPDAQVRCAAIYALASLFSGSGDSAATASSAASATAAAAATAAAVAGRPMSSAYSGGGLYGGPLSPSYVGKEWRQAEVAIACRLAECAADASALVRREVVLALAMLVAGPRHWGSIVCVAHDLVTRR